MPPAGELPDAAPKGLILTIVFLLIAIIAAGAFFYTSQEEQIKDREIRDLTSIAVLKADQIRAWREDRLYDGQVLSSSSFLIDGIDHYLTYGDEESREKILDRFREMNVSPLYDNVLLVDTTGTVRLSLDPAIAVIPPYLVMQVNASLDSGDALMTDFHRIPGTDHHYLYVVAPLHSGPDGLEKPVGAILLSVDSEDFLYPLIQSWPVPSESAETLLVEREDDHVLFLNELRHQKNTSLNLTIPLTQADLPAVMAVQGVTGAFEGRDYRGVNVVSVLEPVPGSPWFIVAKVDVEEVFASWRGSSALIIALIGGTIAGALVILGLLWQRRQKYYYRTLYAAEAEKGREELQNRERMETLLRLTEMVSATEQELADFVLDAACQLTESPLAFIGTMTPNESVFDITAWSKSAMKDCAVAVSPIHYPIDKAGLWAEAVRRKKPVIVNDYSALQPGKKGLPPGHVPVTRFVSVPIFDEKRIVMVCAVANKAVDYTPMDVDNLTLLMQGVWNHFRKRSADEALRQKTTDLEAAYEEITASEEELKANYDELARSQQALEEGERRYRNLYQYAQVGLFETSLKDATVVACNQRYAELAGYGTVEETIGKDILRLYVNPEDRTEVSRILRENGSIENHTVKFRNQSTGKIFWGQFSARYNKERDIAEGTILDVTIQKEAEAEIQNSQNFLNSIIEQSPNAIWISDEKGTLLRLNKACCDLLHITPEEVIGRYNVFEDSIVKAQGKMPLVRSVFEEGESVNFDLEYDSKLLTSLALEQFAKVYLNVTIFPVRDSRGKITNAVIQHLDFTERKQAEIELVAAQKQYRELFDGVTIGILRSTPGPQGTIIEANPAVLRIFEADSREQFLAVHPSDLYADPDQRRKVNDEILAKGAITGIEVRFKTLKGRPFWGRITGVTRTAEDGSVYFDNTLEDITERREAEELLRESEERFRVIFERSTVGKSLTAPDGRLIRVNPAFADMLGYTMDEMQQTDFTRITYPDDLAVSRECIRALLAGEITSCRMEKRYIHKNGKLVWTDVSTSLLKDASGTPKYFITIILDITDRKDGENLLRESEEKYRQLFENITTGFALHEIILDDAGKPVDYRFLIVNEAFEKMTGLNGSDIINQTVRDVLPNTEPYWIETYGRIALSGVPELFENFSNELNKWYEVRAYSPKRGQFATVFTDITEQKEMHLQREMLIKELEEKNAELERFTFTVSHDLKSPLITIKGFAGLIEEDAQKGDPIQLKKDISRITEAASTMQELLADVLELSKIGRVVSAPEKTSFGTIAREAVELLAGPLAERGVRVEITPDLPVVMVDHSRIREVMVNLLENAIKFMGDRPDPVIRIGVDHDREPPVFFVQDNGIGINPRYLARIFNLFERLDVSTPGTGMGLPIVRRIIEVHGGKIWAESEGPGKGTTFRFTLPGVLPTGDDAL